MPQKIKIVDVEGSLKGERDVPEDVLTFSSVNQHVLFEAVNIEHQNKRQGTHESKTKGEVSGTGKKPYRQKHTGRARQGSKRNPHFRGGGTAFGVNCEKNYSIRVNKKVSKIALVSVWFKIVESGQIRILDGSFSKTKEFFSFLEKLGISKNKVLLITRKSQVDVFLFARNIKNIRVRFSSNCSVRDLMNQNYLLITEEALADFFERFKSWR